MNRAPTREKLLEAFNQYSDIHEVAHFFNVSWSTIRCWLMWLNIDFKPCKEVLLMHCLTKTDKEIASL